jgi:hypothetical protein
MPEVTSGLPTRLARIDLTCEGEEDIQFTSKIALDKDGYATQTMEELIREVYYDIYPNHGSNAPATVKVINVSSDYIDTPEDPMIEVLIHSLRNTALDYAVAAALEWTSPLVGKGELSFEGGRVFINNPRTWFTPSRSNEMASYFIDKHQLDVAWVYPNAGVHEGPKSPLIAYGAAHHSPGGVLGNSLPEAVARYMVQSLTPRPFVSIPYSLVPELAE